MGCLFGGRLSETGHEVVLVTGDLIAGVQLSRSGDLAPANARLARAGVRVAKGSRATLDWTRVSEGVWLPDQLQVFASARLGLLQTLRIEQRVHYSRYSSVPEACARQKSDTPEMPGRTNSRRPPPHDRG